MKKFLAAAVAVGFMALPSSALAWGNPELHVSCDETTHEGVGTYSNATFTGAVDLTVYLDNVEKTSQTVSGHTAEVRVDFPPGRDVEMKLVAAEHGGHGVTKTVSGVFHCGAEQLPPAPPVAAPAPPAPVAVTPPSVAPTPPAVTPPATPTAKRHAARKRHRARVRRERRRHGSPRHRTTSHKPPKSTG